jgi:hypothetical protein
MIEDNCVPIHERSAGCITHGNSGRPDECHQTSCPVCGRTVYFVRYNGGTVWFDDLGAPWDKHECMDKQGCTTDHTKAPPSSPPIQFRLMRIRNVVRYYYQEYGVSVSGFCLFIGCDRKPASAWQVYPTDPAENPLVWKGRYCYLASSEGVLTFFNGKTFHLDPHKR